MNDLITTAHAAIDLARDAIRNGCVNTRGYDDAGNPLGGHLTWHARGLIAEARHMLADIGVPWSETVVVLPATSWAASGSPAESTGSALTAPAGCREVWPRKAAVS